MKQYFAIGSYTEAILFGTGEIYQGQGRGITICSLEDGKIAKVNELPLKNPSFLCINERFNKIYAVNEMKEYLGTEGGGITQISYSDDFSMTAEGVWGTGGKDPCHVSLSTDGSLLAVANYSSGSVTTFSLDESGNIIHDTMAIRQHTGSSINTARQAEPHAHSCVFSSDDKLLYVPDLGIDRIMVYGNEGSGLAPNEALTIDVAAGSGPRYGEFSADGKHFYLINELCSEVFHYTCKGGRLDFRQKVLTLAAEFKGENLCADLHLSKDGTKLYASNRGPESISVFNIDENGDLSLSDTYPCGGKTPRNFALDPTGSYLLSGNQDSDQISVFRIGSKGELEKVSEYRTGAPVCIQFFKS